MIKPKKAGLMLSMNHEDDIGDSSFNTKDNQNM